MRRFGKRDPTRRADAGSLPRQERDGARLPPKKMFVETAVARQHLYWASNVALWRKADLPAGLSSSTGRRLQQHIVGASPN